MNQNSKTINLESVATEIGEITEAMTLIIDNESFGKLTQQNALHGIIDHLNRIAEDLRQEGLKQP